MHFGVDYYPEHWVFPYAGSAAEPESRWAQDIELMVECGVTAVRMGEFAWGLYEPEEGRFEFGWMKRCMDQFHAAGIRVILGTPTAAPPVWLARKHPEILPVDAAGNVFHEGTRRAYSANSDLYWDYSRKIITALAGALGDHPALIAWQIDNGLGGHRTEASFNPETRRDWIQWLRQKYETVDRLNDLLGLSVWGQRVTRFEDVPMPQHAPTVHNPALVLDWLRFHSDTWVAYARMQVDLLHELSPGRPVTHNLRAGTRCFDHFDLAEVLDFVSLDSNATIRHRSAENAFECDFARSLKKEGVRMPDDDTGYWVIEMKAGHVTWQAVNSLVRPEVTRLFTYQHLSRGASGVLFFLWRTPRIGPEKFYGGILTHDGRADTRGFAEVKRIGAELRQLGPALHGTRVVPEVAILWSHPNQWSLDHTPQPTREFHQREHVQLFYNALHQLHLPVDFCRPADDLSRYKLVIAPSLQLLEGGEADRLKLYVMNGGTLLATCNTGLVDEHHMAPDTACPHDLTDLFGLAVREFDPLAPGEENHLLFKAGFTSTHMHPARIWCDLIEPGDCEVVATFAREFYSGRPALTMNAFGQGRAIYLGTTSTPAFYHDLMVWLRNMVMFSPLMKVPETIEVSLRQKEGMRIYFLLNHQPTTVTIQFLRPVHDLLSNRTLNGKFDLPSHGVLVLDERSA